MTDGQTDRETDSWKGFLMPPPILAAGIVTILRLDLIMALHKSIGVQVRYYQLIPDYGRVRPSCVIALAAIESSSVIDVLSV